MKLFFETVLRLKNRQVLYRIYYILSNISFFKKIKETRYLLDLNKQLKKIKPRHDLLQDYLNNLCKNNFFEDSSAKRDKNGVITLNFLNQKHKLNHHKWKYNSHSMLWNYTLNYMHWLEFFLAEDIKNNNKNNLPVIENILLNWSKYKSDISMRSYPTSLRLLVWLKIFSFYKIKNKQLIKSFTFQYIYLKKNIEYELDANHLLENLISLYSCSKFLDIPIDIKKYEDFLLKEIDNQFDKNELHYERSFAYHFSIIPRLYLIYFLSDSSLRARIKKILCSANHLLEKFSNKEGVYLFHDATYDMYSQIDNLKKIILPFKYKNELNSIDSGYYLQERETFKLCIDIGNPSPSYQPGHYHCSMTSFIIDYLGKPFIIDTGVYEYYLDDVRRHLSRKTSSHNVMSINSREQSNIWSIFRLGNSASINNFFIEKKSSYDILRIEYIAFPELGYKRCKRLFVINKSFFRIHVIDFVVSKEPNHIKSFLILNPTYKHETKGGIICLNEEENKLYLKSENKVLYENHEIYKRMGHIESTTKFSIENTESLSPIVSYCISDNKQAIEYRIEENILRIDEHRIELN